MGQKLENAKNLYLEGIRDGNAREAVTKYTGDRYTQHSTGVRDGIEGFVEFFEPFISRNPKRDIQIVRGWEDGQYVFIHAFQSLNDGEAKWVTTDFFDTDANDKIIEHWDVIAEYAESTPSGHTSVDGANGDHRFGQDRGKQGTGAQPDSGWSDERGRSKQTSALYFRRQIHPTQQRGGRWFRAFSEARQYAESPP